MTCSLPLNLPLDHDRLRAWMARNDAQLAVAVDHTTFVVTVAWAGHFSVTRTDQLLAVAVERALTAALDYSERGSTVEVRDVAGSA